ncbi:hypothetical protein AJ78_01365 [Emergomyces pasteurianus Ep9510]|uniref:Inositolphosphotransferase Aur1/Ipt1 domain-containing protein n=1 Tax=Emergomyces pasteurianus Ep9510 TaxID=1447872 RepID=A0A1J9PRP7_9EURO|nr:hypothetical protein AJ78_01365 [Emergomyces pasteurianus Ep9510]
MGIGALLEPLVVVTLLLGGTWINRSSDFSPPYAWNTPRSGSVKSADFSDKLDSVEDGLSATTGTDDGSVSSPPYRSLPPYLITDQERPRRVRQIGLWSWRREVMTPNTAIFRNRCFSRLLRKFPFLVECWYWTLVYWTYQLARAFTAATLKDATVDIARKHALELIKLEESLQIFCEVQIQNYFLHHPILMTWTNRLYSFIHIPGTIAFLVWLYYYTTTKNRPEDRYFIKQSGYPGCFHANHSALYEARRRTLAFCNLLAFVMFTLWPCMPPRLLSDASVNGSVGELSRGYGFVDTVHGVNGASSVWTQNRFCNQYAAMPSLHFGYSLMIGITIVTIPLSSQHYRSGFLFSHLRLSHPGLTPKVRLPSWQRITCVFLGVFYPFTILVAIIATANHFILDAFAGAIICGLGWWGNSILLNLLPLEDYLFWLLRTHKPEQGPAYSRPSFVYGDSDEEQAMML